MPIIFSFYYYLFYYHCDYYSTVSMVPAQEDIRQIKILFFFPIGSEDAVPSMPMFSSASLQDDCAMM